MEKYLSNIITEQDLAKIQPGQFNVITAPCGSGKTTFMFDDRILNFARAKKHVLYLIHNKVTRDFIANEHADKACVFKESGWLDHRKATQGFWTCEEDEEKVHVMCYQTFASLLRKEGCKWLDDIDLIVWDEFDDFRPYYEKEVTKLAKMLPNFSRERLIALLQEGAPTSVVNFIYLIKNEVLVPAKIKLLAISATPEFAAMYFSEYLNYILTGKLENIHNAEATIYIDSVCEAIDNGVFSAINGRRYWCYTKYIHEALLIEAHAREKGFQVLTLWSENNERYRASYTAEKARMTSIIRDEHLVPQPYNFVITTGVLGRGVDIYDTSIQDWICNSFDYEDIIQSNRARYSYQNRYLLNGTQGWVEFVQNGFAAEYYQWHSVDEFKELLTIHKIFSDSTNPVALMTIPAVQKTYPDLLEKRRYGKQRITQYRIKPAT